MKTPGRGFMTAGTAAAAVAVLVAGCGGKEDRTASRGAADDTPGKLPKATTHTTLKGLPRDQDPFGKISGTVVRPKVPLPVSAEPGAQPVATLPAEQLGGPTWVPVVDSKPGWYRVLLPSRPNRATGWISGAAGKVETAHSAHHIKVDLSDRRLTLADKGRKVGTWSVAVGTAKTPTPTGRTFLLALLKPSRATYSPLILPVGAHSETLDTYGGGPGTVAFHGWPKKEVFGKAVTHGCIRVPAEALTRLSKVPLGTPVEIVD